MTKEEQLKLVEEVERFLYANPVTRSYDISSAIKDAMEQYKVTHKLVNNFGKLEDFIDKHSCGSYNHFKFTIGCLEIDVTNSAELRKYVKKECYEKLVVKSFGEHTVIDVCQGGTDYRLVLEEEGK